MSCVPFGPLFMRYSLRIGPRPDANEIGKSFIPSRHWEDAVIEWYLQSQTKNIEIQLFNGGKLDQPGGAVLQGQRQQLLPYTPMLRMEEVIDNKNMG